VPCLLYLLHRRVARLISMTKLASNPAVAARWPRASFQLGSVSRLIVTHESPVGFSGLC
jgi:hypothetical protein